MTNQYSNDFESLSADIAELKEVSIKNTEIMERQLERITSLEDELSTSLRDNFLIVREGFTLPKGPDRNSIEAYLRKMKKENRVLPGDIDTFLSPYKLQGGDIILITPKEPKVQRKLKFTETYDTQLKILVNDFGLDEASAKEHAIYTHVAISRGRHQIFESIPEQGVTQSTFWKYMDEEKFSIRVRRLKGLDLQDRSQLVYSIAPIFGEEYGFMDLAALKAKANKLPFLRSVFELIGDDEDYICSGLFAALCQEEFIDLQLNSTSSQLVTPAHLSYSPALEDIEVERLEMPDLFKAGF